LRQSVLSVEALKGLKCFCPHDERDGRLDEMANGRNSKLKTFPLVTVFVGCYNHSRFVEECLDSVRHQTYPNLQVIIFDDCSKDNSVSVIDTWLKKYRLDWQFISHTRNVGICASLNEVLRLARGKYASMVAADDVWLPDKTARQVEMMEQLPEDVGVLYSDAFQIDENSATLPQMFIEAHRKFVVPSEGFLFDVLWEGNFIPAMTTLIRRECFTQVGTYDEDLCFEDWDIWMRISRTFRFAYDKIPAANYRIVSSSAARTMSEAMSRSVELLRVKYFFRGWLNAEQGKDAALALDGVVWRLYQVGSHIPLRWKSALLKQNCSAKTICLIVCSTCGLSFARFQQILAFGVALKEKIFRQKREHRL
jgi:glycosyltransferase involved in cell wall biosynthesis